ncbi:MAG: NusG domain II-containing protein [Bacilli bacterium]|jgi:hypothetical protein|nr:NusG domain II-containing protein [Bacilli bacterium]
MNKSDWQLLAIIIIIIISLFAITSLFNYNNSTIATVYYDNNIVLTLDLSIDENREYRVKGYNGDVVIETKKDMIRVKEEISPLHICSRQGWVKSTYEVIVCLPNKVVITLSDNKNKLDTVVR